MQLRVVTGDNRLFDSVCGDVEVSIGSIRSAQTLMVKTFRFTREPEPNEPELGRVVRAWSCILD